MRRSLHPTQISRVLQDSLAAVRPTARHRWGGTLADDAGAVDLHLVDGWLCIRGPVQSAQTGGCGLPLAALRSQTQSGPVAKLACNGAPNGCLEVRAELSLQACRLTAGTLRGILAGLGRLRQCLSLGGSPGPETSAASVPPDPGMCQLFEAACREAGWPPRVLSDGTIQVELDQAEAGGVALLDPLGQRQFRVITDLADLDQFDAEVSQRGLTQCLLRLNAVVRGVRATLMERPGGDTIVLEAFGLEASSSQAVAAALDALGVAHHLAAAEVEALADPEISREYLSLAGGESAQDTTNQQKGAL